MARENIEAAIMFADVTDSTKLYDTLGDRVANRAIGKSIAIMKQLTEIYNGQVIKTIGDEVMARFPTADDCVNAAKEICEELDAGLESEEIKITAKIGLHFGPAILQDDGDVFGDAVNIAARMQGISGPEQIITTEATVKLLSPELADATRLFDKTQVKGKAEDITIYQVIWENEDLTRIDTVAAPEEEEVKYLALSFKGQEHKIASNENRVFVIGRGVQSDLVVPARLASRSHARIEIRRGRFQVIDRSSNGTYIKTDDGENIYLRRQELLLWGSGIISLGQEVVEDSELNIRFVCPR